MWRNLLSYLTLCTAVGIFITASPGQPSNVFTYVPPHGDRTNPLCGQIRGISPADCSIAVYIFVDGLGWYTKPYSTRPLTPVLPDSTWRCNFVTGGSDEYAIRLRAFIWPNGVGRPPIVLGAETLPSALETLAYCDTIRPTRRQLAFCGDTWYAKVGTCYPGPCNFSDSDSNVWVDSAGQLHLTITKQGNRWYCPEVYRRRAVGYGQFLFQIAGRAARMDPTVVLGLFTWDNWHIPHQEIDIEMSTWGHANDTNAQYVVQPWDIQGHRHRWWLPVAVESATHFVTWRPGSVEFVSVAGFQEAPIHDTLEAWTFTGPAVPVPIDPQIRMNLWLLNGVPPAGDTNLELVVRRFDTTFLMVSVHDESTRLDPASVSINPSKRAISIDLSNTTTPLCLEIRDAIGRGLYTLRTEDGSLDKRREVRIPSLPAGVYFCSLRERDHCLTKKVVLLP